VPDTLASVLAPALPTIESALAARGLLDASALERVRRLEAESGERADRIAAKLGLVSERDLALAYADLLGSPLLAAADFPAEPVAPDRVRPAFARHARLVPLSEEAEDGGAITVAMADPFDQAALRALEFALAKPVLRRAALPADVEAALERLYGEGRSAMARLGDVAAEAPREDEVGESDLERLRDAASEAPVIRLVHALITRLEATEAGLRARVRIDGVLCEVEPPPVRLRAAVVSRVKIMARLNIAERRLAQDGRIRGGAPGPRHLLASHRLPARPVQPCQMRQRYSPCRICSGLSRLRPRTRPPRIASCCACRP
jgi:general secretion pathway protein E